MKITGVVDSVAVQREGHSTVRLDGTVDMEDGAEPAKVSIIFSSADKAFVKEFEVGQEVSA